MADFDIVVYGATGFTGGQAARYLADHAPEGLTFAVAGRRREALEKIAQDTGAAGVIVADSTDPTSVSSMASRARVVLTTAGPYSKYGTPVVEACVEHGRDYVDITGETWWVRDLIDRFHAKSAEQGTRIVPFCGVDSVPADIGALMMVDYFRQRGSDTRRVSTSYKFSGGLNGGTLDTMLSGAESGMTRRMADPFLLNPDGYRSEADPAESRDLRGIVRDEDGERWLAPFIMAPINTRVVRRSNGLCAQYDRPYGDRFVYREAMETRKRTRALAITLGLGAVEKLVRRPLGRRLLQRFGPEPGEGPSDETMDDGLTFMRYRAESNDGERANATWRFHGDPGNRFTVMAVCESALLLATERASLPGGQGRGGVLTPATALGLPLLERMKRAGLEVTLERGPG